MLPRSVGVTILLEQQRRLHGQAFEDGEKDNESLPARRKRESVDGEIDNMSKVSLLALFASLVTFLVVGHVAETFKGPSPSKVQAALRSVPDQLRHFSPVNRPRSDARSGRCWEALEPPLVTFQNRREARKRGLHPMSAWLERTLMPAVEHEGRPATREATTAWTGGIMTNMGITENFTRIHVPKPSNTIPLSLYC